MGFLELLALFILWTFFLILFATLFVFPIYLAYQRSTNWKKFIIPSLYFGPLVLPFVLKKQKAVDDANLLVNLQSTEGDSDKNSLTLDTSLLPGEKVQLRFKAKKVSGPGELIVTDQRLLFEGKARPKHDFAVSFENLGEINFVLGEAQIEIRGQKRQNLRLSKQDISLLKFKLKELDLPKTNTGEHEKDADSGHSNSESTGVPHVESPATNESTAIEEVQPVLDEPIVQPKADEVLKPVEPSTSITEEQAAGVVPPPPPIFKA